MNGNFDFFQNNTYARNCLNPLKGVVQNIHYGDVLIKFGSILDCERNDIPFVNPEIPVNIVKRLVQSGDILIADTAEDNTVGKASEIINVGKKSIVAGLHTIFIRPHSGLFAERFLGYFINSLVYHDQLLPYIVGTKVSSVSKSSLLETVVLRPPLPEQRAIAAALSDVDGYIAALERLIAKKRNIKKGAMQELLTGKRRLPGFSGEWIETTLGSVLKIGHGKSQHEIETNSGKYPILATGGEIGRTNTFVYDKPSVLIGRKGTIDKPQYIDTPFWTIDTLFYTIINEDACPKYLYYLFCTIDWVSLNEASGVPSLSAGIIEGLKVILPAKNEQTAIVAILSDMDTEIDALTKKLNKVHNTKQGMMQELLTGRIRLVDEAKEVEAAPVVKPAAKIIELPKAMTTEKEKSGRSEGYEDAVILVALVNAFGTQQHPFTAFDCQKFPYLFHRHMEGKAKGFKKFAAGPYNPAYKYRTARPIALGKKYIREHMGNYKGFVVDVNAEEALIYFAQWYGDEPLKWLQKFRYIPKRKDELELLTTTDKAMVELLEAGETVSLQAVKELIKKSPAWKDKLKRPIFSDDNIRRAIRWSNELFETEAKPQ